MPRRKRVGELIQKTQGTGGRSQRKQRARTGPSGFETCEWTGLPVSTNLGGVWAGHSLLPSSAHGPEGSNTHLTRGKLSRPRAGCGARMLTACEPWGVHRRSDKLESTRIQRGSSECLPGVHRWCNLAVWQRLLRSVQEQLPPCAWGRIHIHMPLRNAQSGSCDAGMRFSPRL